MQLFGLDFLQSDAKNLLAFSGGADSSALFFLLQEKQISFDMAIVNYGTRENCADEVAYAQKLAQTYHKQIHVFQAPAIESNFEHNARVIRYRFFKQLSAVHNYTNIIVAHQLNDKLEWFLMQLCKGSGIVSLLGFHGISDFEGIRIVRPLINTSRNEILEYLHQNKIVFFNDVSNDDLQIKRNYFRHKISNDLLLKHRNGILRSFEILYRESKFLESDTTNVKLLENLYIVKRAYNELRDLQNVDFALKRLGYVMSFKQRKEVCKANFSCGVGGNFIIDCNQSLLFIGRNHTNVQKPVPKKFREQCRKNKIPPKIRALLQEAKYNVEEIRNLILDVSSGY